MGSFSIFDASSHKPKKGAKPAPKEPPKPLSKREVTEETKKRLFKDPQIKEWIERIETLHQEIESKTNQLIEKGGQSPLSIKRYLDDPKNFTQKDWQLIQVQRDTMDKDFGRSIDPLFPKQRKEKENKTLSKERKGKSLGSRKRWLDMR